MANYIKSFNFRNGVQVDNDNFIVNAAGRVGIGTTVPDKILDVRGNAKVVGHITATDASVSGIVTVGSITINGSTGTISATSFSGAAGNFGDRAVVAIATDGFIAGATGLTTTSNLGIGTDSTAFELQVGGDPTVLGFGVTSGSVTASGNLKISGISTLGVTTVTDFTAQQLSVSGVSTITTLKVGTGITAESGIITATTFDGNLTGDLTGNVSGNLNSTGVSTITTLKVGTGITAEAGIITATTFDGNAGTATSLSNSRDFSITGDLETNVVSFDGTGNVSLASTLSNSLSVNTTGIITAATIVGSAGSFSFIGIQTSAPSADLQIRKASGDATLEVISDTGTASISIGNSVGTGNSSASINYGSTSGFGDFSTSQSLDIINRDTGNINYFLSNSAPTNSGFLWHKGSTNQLMTLTSDGNLGIGITNPEHVLSVQGISTFTGSAFFESAVTFDSSVTIEGTLTLSNASSLTVGTVNANLKGDVQNTDGDTIVDVSEALLSGNVNTSSGVSTFSAIDLSGSSASISIKSDGTNVDPTTLVDINQTASTKVVITEDGSVGIGTTNPASGVDLRYASPRFLLPPFIDTTGRNSLTAVAGALIYNTTTNRIEFYNGSGWVGLTTEA